MVKHVTIPQLLLEHILHTSMSNSKPTCKTTLLMQMQLETFFLESVQQAGLCGGSSSTAWPAGPTLCFLTENGSNNSLNPGTLFTESVELHYSAFGGFSPWLFASLRGKPGASCPDQTTRNWTEWRGGKERGGRRGGRRGGSKNSEKESRNLWKAGGTGRMEGCHGAALTGVTGLRGAETKVTHIM